MITQKVFEQKRKAKEEEAVLKYNTDIQVGLEAIQSDPIYNLVLQSISQLLTLMLEEDNLCGIITISSKLTQIQRFYINRYIFNYGFQSRIESTDTSSDITIGVYRLSNSILNFSKLAVTP